MTNGEMLHKKLDSVVVMQSKMNATLQVTNNNVEHIMKHMETAHRMYNEIKTKQDECPARIRELAGKNERPKWTLAVNILIVFVSFCSLTVAVAALLKG